MCYKSSFKAEMYYSDINIPQSNSREIYFSMRLYRITARHFLCDCNLQISAKYARCPRAFSALSTRAGCILCAESPVPLSQLSKIRHRRVIARRLAFPV